MTRKQPAVPPSRNATNRACFSCILSYIAFILFGFGLTAFSLYHLTSTEDYHTISGPGQVSVRHVAKGLNTILCETFEVTPMLQADVFLVKGKAKVDHRHRVISKRNAAQLNPDSLYTQNDFYLLEGSHIFVNACKLGSDTNDLDESARLLIFKGDDSYQRWRDGKCPECPVSRVRIDHGSYCAGGTSVFLRYKVHHRDTYYIALAGGRFQYRADLTVSQTTFDTRHAQSRCYLSNNCVFNLTFGSDVDIVVKFKDDQSFSSFGTACKLRAMLWAGLFALLPGCLVGLGLCCCCWFGSCCCCGSQRTDKKYKASSSIVDSVASDAHLVSNELPPDYGTVMSKGNVQVI